MSTWYQRVFPNTQMSRVISAYERKTQKQTKNEKERKKMISYFKKIGKSQSLDWFNQKRKKYQKRKK